MNELEKFFSDLPSEDKKPADVFDEIKPAKQEEIAPNTDGEPVPLDNEPRKNREHRRLQEKFQRERESNIALNERIKLLSEVDRITKSSEPSDIPSEWVALYGDTPESQKAWKLQERLLDQHTQRAKEEALLEYEARQQQAVEEQQGFESFIDDQLENLEDTYNVDLTSDAPKARKARREFLELVQNVSPKDGDGSITGYADFNSTFELYHKTQTTERPSEVSLRQKELSSRSMQRPAQNGSQPQTTTPGFRGWMKDYNIES